MKIIKVSDTVIEWLDILDIEYEEWNIEYVDNPKQLSIKDEKWIANRLLFVCIILFFVIIYQITEYNVYRIWVTIALSLWLTLALIINQEIRFKYRRKRSLDSI